MSPTPRNNDEPEATETAAAPAPRQKRRAGQSATTRKPKAKPPGQAVRRRVRIAEGVYKDRHGLAATVKVNGIQRELRFPPGTPPQDHPCTAGRAAGEPADAAGRRAPHARA